MNASQTENNYAFIDSQNLNLSVIAQGWKISWAKFRQYLKDKYSVSKAFLCIGFVATNQSMYTSLQQKGYILIFKPTLRLPNGKVKGNVDSEILLHAMLEYLNYDKAVIVAGDGDYYCLIKHLKQQGKLKKLIIPDRYHYSSLLREFAPDMSFINDLRKKLEYK
jgi:uncharacterized LabA/DUF88 family protein